MNVKIKSASKSAFFCPRVLIGLALCGIGVFLASAVAFSALSLAPPAELAQSSNTNILSITPVEESDKIDMDVLVGCTWSAAPVVPVPILNEAVTTVGSNLYTFGGVSGGQVIAQARSFDGLAWTTIAPLPGAAENTAAVTDGTNIYILGGLDNAGVVQKTLTRYNVATNSYTALAPFTTATWNHAAVFLNGKIYKFTGSIDLIGPPTNVLEIYDVASNTWSIGAPYPQALSFVGAFVQGNFIYGAGGNDFAAGTASAKTYRYDPVANTWNDAAIADLPATRWGAASGFYNGEGVLAGGFVGGSATANISNSAISCNLESNTWSTVPNMLGERAQMNGGVLGGSFYVVGGRSIASSGFDGTNDNQKLICALPTPTPTNCGLGNISTRGVVQTGDNILIGGFIVTGTVPKRVLIRAIGPSLTAFGVPDALADPVLELRGPGISTINDNWKDTQEAAIMATGIPPTSDLESAILATLAPGNYTALVSGKNNTTGVALVEVYNLD